MKALLPGLALSTLGLSSLAERASAYPYTFQNQVQQQQTQQMIRNEVRQQNYLNNMGRPAPMPAYEQPRYLSEPNYVNRPYSSY